MEYDESMRNRTLATLAMAFVAIGGVCVAWAQQKPVSSRTPIVVYKSPT